MRHRLLVAFGLVLIFAGAAAAQSWTVAAHAPVAGHVQASGWISSGSTASMTNPLPAGAVPASHGLGANAHPSFACDSLTNVSWTTPCPGSNAPLSLRVRSYNRVECASAFQKMAIGTTSADVTVDFTLASPTPVAGRLLLRSQGTSNSAGTDTTRIDVDVGADGSVELASTTHDGAVVWLDVPLHRGAAGGIVRVRFTGGQFAGSYGSWIMNETERTIDAHFYPGQPVVARYDTTGASADLAVVHSILNAAHLSLHHQGLALPSILVFGTQPMVLPITPTVTQLTNVDVAFAGNTFSLALPVLPPGFELFCQGLVLDATNTLRTSNSVRAVWP